MKKLSRVVGALSGVGLIGVTLTLAAGTSAVATTAPAIVHAPRIPANAHGLRNTWAASNWSGYAETGSGFAGVTGTWTVPSVALSSSPTYSSAWIGVDGFNNSNLIQTGTEEDYYNGAAHFNAWWEILPAPETALPSSDVVKARDSMKASVYETSATSSGTTHGRFHGGSQHVWVITIADSTQGWSFTTNQSYNGAGTSAEWVMEAPQVGGKIATLANYTFTPSTTGAGDFDNAGVQTNIVGSPTYTPAKLDYQSDSGVMIQNNLQVSTPGDPGNNNTAFNVGYGAPYAPPNLPPSTPTS